MGMDVNHFDAETKKPAHVSGLLGIVAEREGFEPPVGASPRLISSQVHSTELCHLSAVL